MDQWLLAVTSDLATEGLLKIWRLPVPFTAIFPIPPLSLPCVVQNVVFQLIERWGLCRCKQHWCNTLMAKGDMIIIVYSERNTIHLCMFLVCVH